jgi:pimeloyl-ACP methyl ester carboxylesterase
LTRYAAVPHTDHWVHLPQGRLFVRVWTPPQAAGVPIVLFHDSLGSVVLWRGFPAALAERTGRPVIAYDRLGFGHSDPRSDKLDPGFVAAEATTAFPALREEIGFGRFVLFGHSVGGGMAVHCAARFKEDCEALITESAQAFVEGRTLAGIREAQQLFEDPAQVERLQRYHGDKARWVLDAWVDTWLSPAFADWSLDAVLPQLACPVLAIHGADDEYGSVRHPERIGHLAGGPARIEVLADTRHVPHREREPAVLDLAAAFLTAPG